MNHKLSSFAIILTSAALLAGCTKPGAPTSQTPAKTVSEAAEFARAIESGKPTICTMTKDKDVMEYHIKGKLMRINTTTNMTDDEGVTTTTVGHMINDTKYLYVWDDKTKQGSKMSLDLPSPSHLTSTPSEAAAPKFESEANYQKIKDEGYTINCEGGSVDDSLFTPPTDVKFIDPTEMMKAIPSPNAKGQIDMSKLEELQKQYGVPTGEDQ
ncbi:MAG: hypothetical protein ABII21_04030 [bacterium]